MEPVRFSTTDPVSVAQFRDVLNRSTLGQRRPIDAPERLEQMLGSADVVATAWSGGTLVGIARSLTDFTYCCYLSDLAVDASWQRQGIGLRLMEETRARLGPDCRIVLLAAPAAVDYYPAMGFEAHPSAWTLPPGRPLGLRGQDLG